jgi:hypothetical protein
MQRKEVHVMTETETRVMGPQAKEYLEPPEVGSVKEALKPSERSYSC